MQNAMLCRFKDLELVPPRPAGLLCNLLENKNQFPERGLEMYQGVAIDR